MQFRKLNFGLINLLKDINKILCVYDITLNKANIEDSQTNVITNLSNMIESSILINNDKMNKFHKSFLGNMDKILNKIDNIIKLSKNNILIKKKENINFQRCSSPIIKQKSAKEINNYTTTFTPKSSEKINSNKIIVHRKNLTNIKSNY
jgi:hypothetical protein